MKLLQLIFVLLITLLLTGCGTSPLDQVLKGVGPEILGSSCIEMKVKIGGGCEGSQDTSTIYQ